MMKRSQVYITAILALLMLGIVCLYRPYDAPVTRTGYADALIAEDWNSLIADQVNRKGIGFTADGFSWESNETPVYMSDDRQLMIPVEAVRRLFHCNAAVYNGEELKIYRNTKSIIAELSDGLVRVGGAEQHYEEPFEQVGDQYYVSAEMLADGLDYTVAWDYEKGTLQMTDNAPLSSRLPVAYDARDLGRTPRVRDQGTLGTCWAFAAISALEASLLPEERMEFSVDHMSLNNAFGRSQELGGEYTMAMSYLLSWRGPVLEEDDPYGDGVSDSSLQPVKHVQEIRIISQKDLLGIKEAVYLYGGVQTSLHSTLTDSASVSEFYNPETAAYCYIGTEKINHDVTIVGWDDNYSRENFRTMPEGNGAFLCMNSWGTGFGDGGYFWVSYFDSNIGIYNIVYTGVEEPDNYDRIYQSDLCGWVGQLGYGQDSAYFANVYTAEGDESLDAVGFYAVGSETEYEIYIVQDAANADSFHFRDRAAAGSFADPGYYTVRLDEPRSLKAGERFAVIVYIRTPGEKRPIAVEYNTEEGIMKADVTDGEGYISMKGGVWQSTEKKQGCNLCLKAYTRIADRKEGK